MYEGAVFFQNNSRAGRSVTLETEVGEEGNERQVTWRVNTQSGPSLQVLRTTESLHCCFFPMCICLVFLETAFRSQSDFQQANDSSLTM